MNWDELARTLAESVVYFSMTAEARRTAKYHCGPGDSYPINGAKDAHDAWMLAGHADDPDRVRACIKRVAGENNWPLPSTARASASEIALEADVVFSAIEETAKEVLLRGKIFECRAYPDKAFTLTEDEADAAVVAFQPAPGEHGHQIAAGPLDGQLGVMQRVWRSGAELFADVSAPRWLLDRVPDVARKISLVWSVDPTGAKRITRWGWVTNPRIPDAVLRAAFAETQRDPRKEKPMDLIDAIIARLTGNPPPQSEARAAQTSTGVLTAPIAPASIGTSADTAGDSMARFTGQLEMHAPDPAVVALQARLAAQEAETARLRAERDGAKARMFVEAQVRSGKMLPVERAQAVLEAVYAQSLADDSAHEVRFAFGEGQQGNRTAALDALFAALPAHNLTLDADALRGGNVLLSRDVAGGGGQDTMDARVSELLGLTQIGQTALRHKNENGR